jgi:alcohol dehydrogenase (cytochrome c)
VSWRATLYARKTVGNLPELSWNDLWRMTRHQGGFGLEGVAREGVSVDGSVHNPYVTKDDYRAGERIFREHCTGCHGSGGSGGHAAPLNRSGLKHGDTDLAIYRALRDGVPGTMAAPALSVQERWQVVGYVRTLQLHSSGWDTEETTPLDIRVSSEQILAAGNKSDEWLTYSGSLDGRRYTPLSEITPSNVSQLRVRWVRQFDSTETAVESTPLVVNGVIFITEPPSNVIAFDARSGKSMWRYERRIPADVALCCGRVNRGLAVIGHVLFLGSLDGYLIALDANTGTVLWETEVARASDRYSMTGAPLVVGRSVVVGVAGGEFGIRGFLAAYDAETGQQQWKFATIPGPGEPGHETWKNDAWRTGGGATWVTGVYDASLDLLYWGVGNPGPDFLGDVRPGDNLFTNSVIALHASSGTLAWHFQFTPHDEHDWDSNQTPILAELPIDGVRRKVICWANRNGFYYVLDRATGRFLAGTPFVEQSWAKGLDSVGRPIPSDSNEVSSAGRLTRPGVGGGTNWPNPAYDAARGLIFVPVTEGASVFTKSADPQRGDRGAYLGSAGSQTEPPTPIVRALDAATGARKWEHFSPPVTDFGPGYSGLLATGGGLVFGASGGSVFALSSATGREEWCVSLGADTRAAPISFTVDGRQVIVVATARALYLFGL